MSKFFKENSIFISPFKNGEGIRIKILSALANKILIISTKAGVKGTELKKNKHYLEANSKHEFIEKVKQAMENDESMIIKEGTKYLKHNHSRKNNKKFIDTYLSLIES